MPGDVTAIRRGAERQVWQLVAVATVLGALWPSIAQAGVCAAERPDWTPADGPVSGLAELWLFFASPGGALLLVLGVILVLRPWVWPGYAAIALCVVLTQIWAAELAGWLGGTALAAMQEGCQGNPSVKIGLAVVFALLAFWLVEIRRGKRDGA